MAALPTKPLPDLAEIVAELGDTSIMHDRGRYRRRGYGRRERAIALRAAELLDGAIALVEAAATRLERSK
jgi:hypothetical protein